ncbi:CS1-pili formation C-terminal domain-containing protein [Sphingomonas sp. 7/4-4]|uniref:CS1-pili formation C-terminal domain-containing protein n=1 Tax=Sphingomonas sp. 7/4-4 TaxID=3018446 RepID=UPI0022F3D5F0|nr:CS1-pili formation C-terminal domain-containing protein [Sphingomonas sp. 7/4-4]WBY07484.1 CS1-pili formation C-terminal domain-containing protein [Sphingomonas sp. 7/4-4]
MKLGLRNPAESMVLVDLGKVRARPVEPELDDIPPATAAGPDTGVEAAGIAATSEAAPPPRVAEGGYRVTIDGRAQSYVGPGARVALGVQPLGEYVVGLKPEGAPQFDLDATQRSVTVYPGNVVRVRFEAQKVISLFGQVLDAAGRPLRAARVEAGADVALADDRGYFTITAPVDSDPVDPRARR